MEMTAPNNEEFLVLKMHSVTMASQPSHWTTHCIITFHMMLLSYPFSSSASLSWNLGALSSPQATQNNVWKYIFLRGGGSYIFLKWTLFLEILELHKNYK